MCFSVTGDIDTAQSTLQHCLDQDATYSDAHILMAQVSVACWDSSRVYIYEVFTKCDIIKQIQLLLY